MRYLLRLIVLMVLWLPCSLYASLDVKTYIPTNAYQYLDTVKKEQERILPDFAYPYYFAGLIEHESCLSLTHSRCWNVKSRLKTAREEGAGFFQLTRTYRTDGSIRFDTLSDLRRAHMAELKELSWSNVYQKPELQIRAGILLSKQNYQALFEIKDVYQRLAMADAAYNGGIGGVRKERTTCGLASNCDPKLWFDNVERYCSKSKKPLYAGRSACDINRHHVKDVLKTRMPKYKTYFIKDTHSVSNAIHSNTDLVSILDVKFESIFNQIYQDIKSSPGYNNYL